MKTILICILSFLIVPMAIAQTDEEALNMKVIKQWFEVWNDGKYELIPDVVAPNYIRHEPKGTRTISRENYGKEIKYSREKLNIRFINHKTTAFKNQVWNLWTIISINANSGEKVLGSGISLYRLEKGKLVETWWSGSINQGAWPEYK